MFVYKSLKNGISVRLDLPPGGSTFVVFGKKTSAGAMDLSAPDKVKDDASLPPARVVALDERSGLMHCWRNGRYTLTDGKGRKDHVTVKGLPAPRILDGQWKVKFDPKWGAPAEIKLRKLISWTDHDNAGVKYYSGSGFYTRALDVPAAMLAGKKRVSLDLGDVRALAEVFVNGKSAGVLWKAPFRADITDLVKPGVNALKIEVMNLWINRLSGDMKLPPEKRFCRTNIVKPSWRIQPAGLLGPVRLMSSVLVQIDRGGK